MTYEHEGLLHFFVGKALRSGVPASREDLLSEARVVALEAEHQHSEDQHAGRFPAFLANRLRWRFATLARSARRERSAISRIPASRSVSYGFGKLAVLHSHIARKLTPHDQPVLDVLASSCVSGEPPTQSEIAELLGRSKFSVSRSMKRIREVTEEA